jgi:hypothetical protein
MSTKTLRKRIALVAVASLGFGLLSVAPSGAGAGDEVGTASVTSITTATGATALSTSATVEVTTAVTVAYGTLAVGTLDAITVVAAVTAKPAGSTASISWTAAAADTTAGTETFTPVAAAPKITGTFTANATDGDANISADSSALGTVGVTPSAAGSYTVDVWHDQNRNGTRENGEQYQTFTVTAVAAGGATANQAAATGGTATNIFGATSAVTIGAIAPVRAATPFAIPIDILTGNTTQWTNAMVLDGALSVASSPALSVITCAAEEGGTYTAANCSNLGVKIRTAASAADNFIETGTAEYVAGKAADGTTAAHEKSVWRATVWAQVSLAGTYLFNASMTDAAGTPVAKSTAVATTVVTRGVATAIKLTPLSTAPTTDSDLTDGIAAGTSVVIEMTDASGFATVPSATESLTVSAVGPTGVRASSATVAAAGSAVTSLASGDFNDNSKGYASFTLQASAAGTATVTVTGLQGVASTVSGSTTVTFATPTVDSANTDDFANPSTTAGASVLSGVTTMAGATYDVRTATVSPTRTTVPMNLLTARADKDVHALRYEDTSGLKYGIANLFYTTSVTLGTTGDVLSHSIPLFGSLGNGDQMVVRLFGDGNVALASQAALTLTGAVSIPNATLSAFDAANINTVPGSAISATITLRDQFNLAIAGHTLTFAVSGGRNTVSTGLTKITDANGQATFTYTDTGSAGVDTISVTPTTGSLSGDTVTITYNAADAVSKVVVTGPNTDEVVPTPQDINASSRTGAQNGQISTVYATVTNAGGAALAGVPVVFTISGTTAAIRSTHVTVFTDALGVATTRVYAWAEGKYTITATAAGKTGTTDVTFAQVAGQAEARTISAAVSGNIVKATVKDRFGNPIASQDVYATRTGDGFFANGAGSTSAKTNVKGEVEFIISGGAAKVTVQLGSTTSADAAWGQSDAVKGNLDGALATAVLTASAAGTTLVGETGVGASFDAAGVNSVTVDVAATENAAETAATAASDAAAEATDAANAATDAANAAAEAADAATAAAQDAADAVAALSTQVSEMVDALKKQITALTNLVIKIQKKVRA